MIQVPEEIYETMEQAVRLVGNGGFDLYEQGIPEGSTTPIGKRFWTTENGRTVLRNHIIAKNFINAKFDSMIQHDVDAEMERITEYYNNVFPEAQ